MNPMAVALAEQFARSWWMLRDVIGRIPAREWYEGDRPELVPARWAFHLVHYADAYVRPDDPDRVPVADPDDANVRDLPDRRRLSAYIDEVEARCDAVLRQSSDDALLAENVCHWTGANVFERMVYVLRHNMQHIGELQATLRQRDLKPGRWR